MLLQVLSLSPDQINALDPSQRQSIVQLVGGTGSWMNETDLDSDSNSWVQHERQARSGNSTAMDQIKSMHIFSESQ